MILEGLRKAARRWKGSAYSLARVSGVSDTVVQRFLRGSPITMDTAEKLAVALGVDLTVISRGDAPQIADFPAAVDRAMRRYKVTRDNARKLARRDEPELYKQYRADLARVIGAVDE